MRFLINVIDTRGSSGTDDEMNAIDVFNESLQLGKHWVMAAGIADPSHSIVVDNRNDLGLVKASSYVEGSEFVSGFWVIEAASIDQAQSLALRASKACNRRVELRPFLGN